MAWPTEPEYPSLQPADWPVVCKISHTVWYMCHATCGTNPVHVTAVTQDFSETWIPVAVGFG